MWWFPEFYKGLSTGEFIGDVLRGHYWSTWRNYFIDREVEGASAAPDMIAFFPKDAGVDIDPTIINPEAVPPGSPIPEDSIEIIGGLGTELGQLTSPADVAVDADGNLYVVDSHNQRIQRISPDGEAEAVGESGSADGQFKNPEDDGFFVDGPWGIALDGEGNIYVADTWNHRMQKFDNDLGFVMQWGDFFGPRDVVQTAEGELLIVDTGNARIRRFTTDGQLIGDIGAKGDGPNQFNEPSGIALGPTGEVFVADYWNQRIQHFDAELNYIESFEIPSWGSQGVSDRAYIAIAPGGEILATDPGNQRVIVLDAAGNETGAWALPSPSGFSRPIGITIDPEGEFVYIADAAANQVVKVPVEVLLGPPPAAPAGTAAPTAAATPAATSGGS
jgi:sugar lactone lactonase YvrE